MNKAVFLFTMKRFTHWEAMLWLCGTVLSTVAILLSALMLDSRVVDELVRSFLFGPLLPFLVAATMICPQVANSKRRKDGEYLSLLFTRPISRFSYVITKWLSGSLMVLCVLSVSIMLLLCTAALLGHYPKGFVDWYAVADLVLNCFAYAAVCVLFSTLPPIATYLLVGPLIYLQVLLAVSLGSLSFMNAISVDGCSLVLMGLVRSALSIMNVRIDTYHVLSSSAFPPAEFAAYFSNVVLYLTLAVFIMSQREFFYAND